MTPSASVESRYFAPHSCSIIRDWFQKVFATRLHCRLVRTREYLLGRQKSMILVPKKYDFGENPWKIILFSVTLSQKPYFRIEFRVPCRWIFFISNIMHLGSSVPIFSSKLDEPLFGLSTLRVLPYAPACNCAAYSAGQGGPKGFCTGEPQKCDVTDVSSKNTHKKLQILVYPGCSPNLGLHRIAHFLAHFFPHQNLFTNWIQGDTSFSSLLLRSIVLFKAISLIQESKKWSKQMARPHGRTDARTNEQTHIKILRPPTQKP